ncbi:MAG: outer membrane protein assembly factor BamB [Nevskiales bacterium]
MSRSFPLLFAIAMLAGCSVFGGGSTSAPTEQPAVLAALPAGAVSARVLWRAGAGQAPKKDYYGLRLALDERHLYAADGAGRVSAFDPNTGRATWQARTQPRLAAGVGVAGDKVLVGTLDGEVIALGTDSGSPQWRAGVSSEVLTAPLGDGETVVVRTGDGRLYGFAAVDGQRLWTFDRAVPTLSLRGISQPVVADGRVYAGLDTGKLIALDLSSGRLLWEESVSAPSGRSEIERLVDLDADPVLADDVLYAVSYGGQLVALDAASGKLKWRQALGSYSGLAVEGDRVYVTDREGRVSALDRASGAVLWQQDGLKHRQLTRPVIHGGLVAIGDFEGYLHWLSPEDGSLRGRLSAGRSALVASPLVVGGRLYVLGRAGDITAIELPGSG